MSRRYDRVIMGMVRCGFGMSKLVVASGSDFGQISGCGVVLLLRYIGVNVRARWQRLAHQRATQMGTGVTSWTQIRVGFKLQFTLRDAITMFHFEIRARSCSREARMCLASSTNHLKLPSRLNHVFKSVVAMRVTISPALAFPPFFI